MDRDQSSTAIARALRTVVIFVGILWAVYFADWLLGLRLENWGIVPRQLGGLVGIPLSPFIHGGLGHLFSNTIPLIVLLTLLIASRPNPWPQVVELILLSGLMLWLLGRNGSGKELTVHIGASGLIYALIVYLVVAGLRERQVFSMAVAVLVGFLYGFTLLWGILPTQRGVSWDGHLTGAIAGGLLAWMLPSGKATAESKTSSVERLVS
jgi:membrane associated rhomboid family serine protease